MVSSVSHALGTSATYQKLATTHSGEATDPRNTQERLSQEKARAEKTPPPSYTTSQRGSVLNLQV